MTNVNVTFTIDPATGQLTSQINGVAGPGCEDIAKEIRKLLGEPTVDRKTPEYAQTVRTTRTVTR